LALLSAVLIAAEWFSITASQTETIGKENRFLTTEWYLLQQLRAQTDAELTQKNQEIENLRRLYEQLKAENNASNDLDRVEAELKAAESTREAMLTKSVTTGLHPSLSAVMPEAAVPVPPAPSAQAADLRQAIEQLQEQLNGQRARAEAAEAAVVELKRQQSAPTSRSGSLSKVVEALDNAKSLLGTSAPATVAELKTKALIRAILSSSDVKRQYPDLLAAFDGYLDSFGTREYSRGRITGFNEAAQTVRDQSQ
jgi:hypothetical protein